jgi:hypothetical protein
LLSEAFSGPVLDFRRGPRPGNYLSRRAEWRLLLLVALLGVSILLIGVARDPENFAWLWKMGQGRGDQPAAAPSRDSGSARNRPRRAQHEADPATVFAPAAERRGAARPAAEPAGAEQSERDFPRVDPSLLEQIRDDSPFRSTEKEAWFQMLRVLEGTEEEVLQTASIGRVTFVQLFQQPDQYRGELVTVVGTLRRAERVSAPTNDYGFRRYTRVVLQPEDNPRDPMIGYVLQLPEEMPRGMEIEERVEITGFFFKRWEYAAQSDLRIAPVVLAKTVRWTPRPAASDDAGGRAPSVPVVIGVALGFALLLSLLVYSRTRLGRVPDDGSLAASRMFKQRQPPVDVEWELKKLAEQEDSIAPSDPTREEPAGAMVPCPNCSTKVIPKADGTCPACQLHF